jgi:uncharacterized phage protein gp47/JayE
MAFITPTLLEIWTRWRNSARTYLPGTDSWIEPNNLSVTGRSFSLSLGSAYERAQYLYRQLFASTADAEHLEYRHAFEYGISRKAASLAEGVISFDTTGSAFTLPIGYLVTGPNGLVFEFLNSTPVAGGVVTTTAEVRAQVAGSAGNLLPNTPMTFAPDISFPDLPESAVVSSDGFGGGADVESDEELRARVLNRKRQPPHGGSRSDYEQWALEVPGVTRVFVSPFKTTSANDVAAPLTLYPMFDKTRANGIPNAYDLLAVAQHLDPLRPVTARVYIKAPTPRYVNIEIGGLAGDTSYLRDAIETNLADMFYDRVPVVTAENQFTLPVAWIDEAIARAPGYSRHRMKDPTADVVFEPGELPILGSVVFSF